MVYTVQMIRDNLHEDFARKQEGRASSDRAFGVVFAAFFVIVALLPLRHHHPMRLWALPLTAMFLLIALLKPTLLSPLNKYWTKLGLLMGRIVSPVVTAILFYLVVTPTALLFRLMGKNPLRLAFEPQAQSYWIVRRPPGPAPETMANQF